MFFNEESFEQAERNLAWDEASIELADRLHLSTKNPEGFNELPDADLTDCSTRGSIDTPTAANRHLNLELLRTWKFQAPTVVMGRASKVHDEVFLERCQNDSVPVLRRSSGGSTIVAGPGCLMYSVLISYNRRPDWRSLDVAHKEVMSRISDAVKATLQDFDIPTEIALQGTCDLTWNDAKFSGNALRCKRQFMLYHGTILLDMPVEWVSKYLKEPPRQPEYRLKRNHESFVRTLSELIPLKSRPTMPDLEFNLIRNLRSVWNATQPWSTFPLQQEFNQEVDHWLQQRYLKPSWHLER